MRLLCLYFVISRYPSVFLLDSPNLLLYPFHHPKIFFRHHPPINRNCRLPALTPPLPESLNGVLQRCYVRPVSPINLMSLHKPFFIYHQPHYHLLTIPSSVPAIPIPRLAVPFRSSFKITARQIVQVYLFLQPK